MSSRAHLTRRHTPAPSWPAIEQRLRSRGSRRRYRRDIAGFGTVLAVVVGEVSAQFVGAWGYLGLLAVTMIGGVVAVGGGWRGVTVHRTVDSERPRPELQQVLDRLADLAADGESESVRSTGAIEPLRPDVWALGVQELTRAKYYQHLRQALAGHARTGRRVEDLSCGVDLLERRQDAHAVLATLAREGADGVYVPSVWQARGHRWWVRVGRDGQLSLVRRLPAGTGRYAPPQVPVDSVLSGGGDSAGLALFLAYVADMLGVVVDQSAPVAATGHVLAGQVLKVGGVEEKAHAATDAGAALLILSDHQPVTFELLTAGVPVVSVRDTATACSLWLTFRAASPA